MVLTCIFHLKESEREYYSLGLISTHSFSKFFQFTTPCVTFLEGVDKQVRLLPIWEPGRKQEEEEGLELLQHLGDSSLVDKGSSLTLPCLWSPALGTGAGESTSLLELL